MLDDGIRGVRLERARGQAAVTLAGGRLRDLQQSGAAKAMLPKTHNPVPEVVFLNTAGGVTGGDRLETQFSILDGAGMGTTQTAERAYRSAGDAAAQVGIRLMVGAGAKLAWLPQETILYDGAALQRQTQVEMAEGAELVLVDIFVLGRIAMGETVSNLTLRDERTVRQAGRVVLHDPLRIGSDDLHRSGCAGLGDARAVAVLHLLAPDAEDRLARLRAVLPGDGSAAASAWDGRLSLRAMHRDPTQLRRMMARAIPCLTGQPLPRVWPNEWS